MGEFFKNIDWKAVGNAFIETMKSIGRGDILMRMQVHRFFPAILYLFGVALLSIWLSYMVEKTMYKVEENKKTIENLKIDNANKTCEIVSLSRMSTVESMLEEAGSEVKAPTKPTDIIKK